MIMGSLHAQTVFIGDAEQVGLDHDEMRMGFKIRLNN
jgi:hypothetical protein